MRCPPPFPPFPNPAQYPSFAPLWMLGCCFRAWEERQRNRVLHLSVGKMQSSGDSSRQLHVQPENPVITPAKLHELLAQIDPNEKLDTEVEEVQVPLIVGTAARGGGWS